MALIKKPVTGMKDILPEEMQLREYLMGIIKETYTSYGFSQIEVPAVEHIENLLSKQGGDNEKLIFKILKRGEKLKLEDIKNEEDLADGGLRYDLTLPLARYYSNNCASLPNPFKALHMGSVWRADRPQKGRFRQFTQCDIDILGEESNLAEIELILATTTALLRVCPENKFCVRINDRNLLRSMALYAGFAVEDMEKVFIILDKLDKIGIEGIKNELVNEGFAAENIDKYLKLFEKNMQDKESILELGKELNEYACEETLSNLYDIMSIVETAKQGDFKLIFDPTLVRGMGYYTGTIFEVSMEGFSGSVAGGGRYDRMIGRFTGKETPACGFSIGFERILGILADRGFKAPIKAHKKAILFEKGTDRKKMSEILSLASKERAAGNIVLLAKMNKNKKFQKEQLTLDGYEEFIEFYKEGLK